VRCVYQKRTPSVLFHRFVHQVDEESDTEGEMNKDGKIKAPPSVGVLVVSLPGFLARLRIWCGVANANNSNKFNNNCAAPRKDWHWSRKFGGPGLPDFFGRHSGEIGKRWRTWKQPELGNWANKRIAR
jgi:hypothetical protein